MYQRLAREYDSQRRSALQRLDLTTATSCSEVLGPGRLAGVTGTGSGSPLERGVFKSLLTCENNGDVMTMHVGITCLQSNLVGRRGTTGINCAEERS